MKGDLKVGDRLRVTARVRVPGYQTGDKGTVVIEQDDVLRWELTPETAEDQAVKQRFAQKTHASGGSSNPAAMSPGRAL